MSSNTATLSHPGYVTLVELLVLSVPQSASFDGRYQLQGDE
jgi:type IV secretory pathway protease TraF